MCAISTCVVTACARVLVRQCQVLALVGRVVGERWITRLTLSANIRQERYMKFRAESDSFAHALETF